MVQRGRLRISGFLCALGLGFKVQGLGFRVEDFGVQFVSLCCQGLGLRV